MRTTYFLAFALAAGTLPTRASAQDTFSYTVGSNEIVLLSENQGQGNAGILIDASPEILARTMPDGTYPNAVNAFLIKWHGHNILVDAGFGTRLFDNLRSVGVEPEEVHEVYLTHMHGDHIGGLLRDGERAFPNARLSVGKAEHDYWTSDEQMNKLPENRRGNFVQAREVIAKYGDVQLLDPVDIADVPAAYGVYPVEAYGHTPGHIGFMVVCGGNRLLIWGDLTHAMAVQMPYPRIAVTYDVDPATAVSSRLRILEYVDRNGIPIAGMHIVYPGIGSVRSDGQDGYVFTPAE